MKIKPTYSTVNLYKNEISVLEYYKSMCSDNLENLEGFTNNFIFSSSTGTFPTMATNYIKYLEASNSLESYNKKIIIKQKTIKDLEERYDFSMINLKQGEVEVMGNEGYDFSLCDLCIIL